MPRCVETTVRQNERSRWIARSTPLATPRSDPAAPGCVVLPDMAAAAHQASTTFTGGSATYDDVTHIRRVSSEERSPAGRRHRTAVGWCAAAIMCDFPISVVAGGDSALLVALWRFRPARDTWLRRRLNETTLRFKIYQLRARSSTLSHRCQQQKHKHEKNVVNQRRWTTDKCNSWNNFEMISTHDWLSCSTTTAFVVWLCLC